MEIRKKYHIIISSLLIILLLFVFESIIAQSNDYPSDYFRPPLETPLYLSGTFGELRSNHFHSGIDIKTGGTEGKNIYAIADGYVSRIKISTGGYGKALYVTHPNGYVSVYGHLQKYNKQIQEFVTSYQYKKESFTVEIFPEKDLLKVNKGNVIAISGNTGSSAGPHLHFEIREDATQYPVNPLLFKSLKIKDYYRPKILEIALYPVDEHATINGENDAVFYVVAGWGDEHYLIDKPKITVSGRISFGIRTYDLMNDIPNKNGVYKIEIVLDTTQIFGLKMNEFSFSTTRYINSLIDYGYYKKMKRRMVRTEIDTNNRLNTYRNVVSNGIVVFDDSLNHTVKYIVGDAYGNTAKLQFKVNSVVIDSVQQKIAKKEPKGIYFDFRKQHEIAKENITLSFPSNAFYKSFYFELGVDSSGSDSCPSGRRVSPVYKVHNRFTAVQKAFSIKIKPDPIPEGLKDKMYIAYSNGNDNGNSSYIGSHWDKAYLMTKSRILGDYFIKVDSVAPEIIPANIGKGKDISGQNTIKMKIKDGETGISYYRGTLNDQWILMEYDAKKQLLTYHYDHRLQKGENNFKLIIKDILGNVSEFKAKLIFQ